MHVILTVRRSKENQFISITDSWLEKYVGVLVWNMEVSYFPSLTEERTSCYAVLLHIFHEDKANLNSVTSAISVQLHSSLL